MFILLMASDHNDMKKIIFWPVNDMQLKTWFMQMSYNENDSVEKRIFASQNLSGFIFNHDVGVQC